MKPQPEISKGRTSDKAGKPHYKIVDSNGKKIDTFIHLVVAREFKRKLENQTGENYEIEYL